MSGPSLLFLHGIDYPGDVPWDLVLKQGLENAGYKRWASVPVLVPDYIPELERARIGGTTRRTYAAPPSEKTRQRERSAFRQRQASLAHDLRITSPSKEPPRPGLSASRRLGLRTEFARQARNYLDFPEVRDSVRFRVLSEIGANGGEFVVLAHSLGTVIALDLAHYLPKGTFVPLLVTVASPAHEAHFYGVLGSKKEPYRFPYGVVGSWLNVFNPRDVIAGGRGLGSRFPEAIDYVRSVGASHSLSLHLEDEALASAIGASLFAPLKRQVHKTRRKKLPPEAVFPLLLSQYALRVEEELQRDRDYESRARRYAIARRELIARVDDDETVAEGLGSFKSLLGTDASSLLLDALSRDDSLLADAALLIVTANPIMPFEIQVSQSITRRAWRRLEHDVGLRMGDLDKADGYLDSARSALRSRVHVDPLRLGLGVVGVAIAIAAPVALAAGVAAAPAAGAAAITAALAAFGPGGMVGGLLTLGLAVGGGSVLGTSTLGHALSQASPATFRQSATELVARAQFARHLGIPEAGTKEWDVLSIAVTENTRELHGLEGISDEDSDRIRTLRKNIQIARSALGQLSANGFGTPEPPRNPESA